DFRASQRDGVPYQGHSIASMNGMPTPSYDQEKQDARETTRYPLVIKESTFDGQRESRNPSAPTEYQDAHQTRQRELSSNASTYHSPKIKDKSFDGQRYPSPPIESQDGQTGAYERYADFTEDGVQTEYTSTASIVRPGEYARRTDNAPPTQHRMQPTGFEPPLNHSTMAHTFDFPAARHEDDVSYSRRTSPVANIRTEYTSSAQNRAIRPEPTPDYGYRSTAPSNPFPPRPESNPYSNIVPGAWPSPSLNKRTEYASSIRTPTRSELGPDSGYILNASSNLSPSLQHCTPTRFEPRPNSGYSPTEAFKADPRLGPPRVEPPQINLTPRSESNQHPTFYPSTQFCAMLKPSSQPHIIGANGRSQYTSGAASSCIPSCMEACLQLVYGRPLCLTALDNILKAGSRYRGADHIEAGELQASVERYSKALRVVVEQQYPLTALERVVRDLAALARDERQPVAAIVTRPPESVVVAVDPRSETPVVLFDSHPRPEFHLDNAAFLCFEDQRGLVEYLHRLMSGPEKLHLEDLDAYTTMIMGSVSVLVFKASKQGMDVMLSESDLLGLETQYKNFQLQQQNLFLTKQCEGIVRKHQREIDNLRTEIIRPYDRELDRLKQEVRTVRDKLEVMNIQQGRQQSGQRDALGRKQTGDYWNFGIMDRGAQYCTPSPRQPQPYTTSGPSGERCQPERPDRTNSFDSDRELALRLQEDGKRMHESDADMARLLQEQFAIEESCLKHAEFFNQRIPDGDHELALELQAEEEPHIHEGDADIARRLQEEFELEESRIRADRTHAESLHQSILECPICSSEYPVDSTFHIDECGHDICRTCATQYVQTAIETRTFPCLCPCCIAADDAENPSSVISQNMVLSVLKEEGQRRWLEIERERAITSDPTVIFTNCRNPECGKPSVLGTATEASGLTSVQLQSIKSIQSESTMATKSPCGGDELQYMISCIYQQHNAAALSDPAERGAGDGQHPNSRERDERRRFARALDLFLNRTIINDLKTLAPSQRSIRAPRVYTLVRNSPFVVVLEILTSSLAIMGVTVLLLNCYPTMNRFFAGDDIIALYTSIVNSFAIIVMLMF
ncbi:hypothetical protein BC938DRAFT_480642, partial [Jimgerdemannia flammicorona]